MRDKKECACCHQALPEPPKPKGIKIATAIGIFNVTMRSGVQSRNSIVIEQISGPYGNEKSAAVYDDAIVRPYVLSLLLSDLKNGYSKIEDL